MHKRSEGKEADEGHVILGTSKTPDVITVLSILAVLVGVVMCSGYWLSIRPAKMRKKQTMSGATNRGKDEFEG
jgi:hypothetical protein